MSRLRRGVLGVSAVLLVAAVAACEEPAAEEEALTWPSGGEPLDPSGVVWAEGHTVHLGDDTTVDTRDPVHEYAIAGDAVYFTRAGDEAGADDPVDTRLWRATRQTVEQTDAYAAELTATADGRYLVYLDEESGPEDDHGTPVATVVAVDTRTGEETVRSTEGMGSTSDDLAALYEDSPPTLRLVTGDTAYVSAAGTTRAFDLGSGDAEEVEAEAVPGLESSGDLAWNASRSWAIEDTHAQERDVFVSADDRRVAPRTGTRTRDLVQWIDDTTAVAVVVRPPGLGEDGLYHGLESAALLSCEVPSGRCSDVPGATGEAEPMPFTLPQRSQG